MPVPAVILPKRPASISRACLLMGTAEEGIGRDADGKAPFVRRALERRALVEIDDDRLFAIDVLAGAHGVHIHREMRRGRRHVEDDVDLVVGEERIDRLRADAELAGREPPRWRPTSGWRWPGFRSCGTAAQG